MHKNIQKDFFRMPDYQNPTINVCKMNFKNLRKRNESPI